jgi:hypothetical protein
MIQGFEIQRFDGLAIQGFDGLSIVNTTAFPRPVQIVRQTISNLETQICRISAYHNYKGLSRPLKKAGIKNNKPYPYGNNKPSYGHIVDIRFGI